MTDLLRSLMKSVDHSVDQRNSKAGMRPIGELAARLESVPPDTPVILRGDDTDWLKAGQRGIKRGSDHSYRGYYRLLSVASTDDPDKLASAGELAEMLSGAIGRVYEGYKGGDFRMSRTTVLWISGYSYSSGLGVVGFAYDGEYVTLQVADVESDEPEL